MFPDLLCDDVFSLETRRLWLRWPKASDAAEIARLAGDAAVAGATARVPHPYPAEAGSVFVLESRRENSEGKSLTFVLCAKDRPGIPLGAIALIDAEDEKLELGYWLGRPHWRQGLMTEATLAMVDLAFAWTSAREILAVARADNVASQRLLEKCGFRLVGQVTEEVPARWSPWLASRFSLTLEAWTHCAGTVEAPLRSGLR